MDSRIWHGKRVLITGHTGFKGSWLSLWLHRLGANVHGISLDPPTTPNLFEVANVAAVLASDRRIDIQNQAAVLSAFQEIQPHVLFHLAAQSLVTRSYQYPIETFSVNVMGTAHVLQAAHQLQSVSAVVVVTTDKCYANKEKVYLYKENDELGGSDPYSSSKACAELVTSAYRSSYLAAAHIATATARAGNVMGGGDWADNRLLPDCVRAYFSGTALDLRLPSAVRPWQHVLEPLAGYLSLAEALLGDDAQQYGGSWNFGPNNEDIASVGEVISLVGSLWNLSVRMSATIPHLREAVLLHLDSTKARTQLGWKPRWTLQQAIENTLTWYVAARSHATDMQRFSLEQIADYERALPR